MIGSVISHYKILEKLGEGGMGVVYKAQDTTLNRAVALKFLPPHMSASDQDKARFMQEAQAAAALNHPNICTIYGIEDHEGQMFIAMELVEGQTLHERGMNTPLKQAIEIGIQLADGLAAAHEKGIVHRDIKPENIMLQKDGRVRIMDFGLAKLKSASRLTKAGSTVGTTGYMSPEQVQGLDSDHRSDIFSLGVILYEMFAGQSPFKGMHETAINYEIVNVDPEPISVVKPEIAPELDAIVLECLEKELNERAQSAKQVAIDLKRFKRESSRSRVSRISSARPLSRSEQSSGTGRIEIPMWKNIVWPFVATVSTIALVIVLWSPWKHETVAHVVTRAVVTLPKDQLLNTTSYVAVTISPDGALLVYKANGKLHLRNMNSFDSTPIPGTEDASGPFFSPDGKWIGFFSTGKLRKIPVSGGASTVLEAATDNRGATWGKEGDIVFVPQSNTGLMHIREGGGGARELTKVDTTKNERTHRWPFFLPDGKTVIYTVGTMDSPDFYDDAVIEAVNIETGVRKVIMKGGCSAQYASAGFLVYWRSSSLFAVSFDYKKLEIMGTSFPVLENVNGDPATGMAAYFISQNGTLAYIPGNAGLANQSLSKLDLHGVVTPFEAPLQSYMEPRISPDGSRIATSIQYGKDADIWVYDIPRKSLSKLTFGGVNRTPAWSPDGKRIAYYAYDGGKQSLIVRQADGSGEPEILNSGFGRMYIDSWSRDGSVMIFDISGATRKVASPAGAISDLFMMSLTGDRTPKPFLETQFDEWQASLSPDGKWIAYSSNESGTYQVYIRQFPQGGGKWVVSTGEGYGPHWAPDGKTLYYYTPGKLLSVPIQIAPSLVVGKPQVIVNGYQQKSVDSGLMYDISPDGQWFVVAQSKDDESNFRQIHLIINWFDEIQAKMPSSK
jgi:serine/threonine-protein kinase